jgi:hypothetical protein
MVEREPNDVAEALHGLLNGRPSPDERRRVLWLVAGDEAARDLLRRMLVLERQARAAYGLDRAETQMRESLASLLASLRSGTAAGAAGNPPLPAGAPPRAASPGQGGSVQAEAASGRRTGRTTLRFRRAFLPLAAAVAVAASVVVAVVTHVENERMRDQLARFLQTAAAPPLVTPAECAGYRRIWSEVASTAGGPEPWILLSDGGGEFGYLPATAETGRDGRLLLVRCVVLTADNRPAETVNLLVPAGRDLRLTLPEVGELAGLPVACDIAAHDGWAAVGLTVGSNTAEAVGVRGRVGFGDRSVEIGQFRLNDRPMRVIVQAVPLDGRVG